MAADESDGERPGLAEAPAAPSFADGELPPVIRLDRHRRALPAPGGPPPLERGQGRPIRVLVVGDEEEDFLLVRDLLARAERARFQVCSTRDPDAALVALARGEHDVCLCDQSKAAGGGLALARKAVRRGIAAPVIVVSGLGLADLDLDAVAAGAADYLDKEQYDVEALERIIRMALARARRQAAPAPALASPDLFRDRVRRALTRARRRGSLGAVLLLAVDRLETLDRRRGEDAVEGLLQDLAERLPDVLREADTLLRLGRDRFGIVLEDLHRPEHAALVAHKLVTAIAARPWSEMSVTASAGLAMVTGGAIDAGRLEATAGAALARAQAEGGGRCCQHDLAEERAADATLELAQELEAAIHADALDLHFQPQVTLCSAELALVAVPRWRHPAAGLMEGEPLRRLAEAGGLIEALDDWTIAAACRQALLWHEGALAPAHVAVRLLSRRPLRWSDLPRRLRARLDEAGLAPRWLELEIDERVLLDDLEACGGAVLREVSALGVRLAVPGFGGGPSSLALLRDGPLTTVKLAGTLLRGTPDDHLATQLAVGLIRFTRDLELRLVAEEVEGQGQLQLLRAHGCDAVQSYASCPPLPPDACSDWLRQAACRSG